ncbi:MAG: hypothetical protein ACREX0_02145, partial [Noviherbaspirillum sp.]
EKWTMELVLLELVLWGGLLFFFWALKDGLGKVESDIDSLGVFSARAQAQGRIRFYAPERVAEPIGSYGDVQIYRYAVFQGRIYQFDRVCPAESGMTVDADERCIAPGLVYQECSDQPQLAGKS